MNHKKFIFSVAFGLILSVRTLAAEFSLRPEFIQFNGDKLKVIAVTSGKGFPSGQQAAVKLKLSRIETNLSSNDPIVSLKVELFEVRPDNDELRQESAIYHCYVLDLFDLAKKSIGHSKNEFSRVILPEISLVDMGVPPEANCDQGYATKIDLL